MVASVESEGRFRIAIVDDEPCMRRALGRLLTLNGFLGDTFSSGEEFLRSLAVHAPDCVVLDLYLSGMTGFEVQARMKEAGLSVPVIAMTGHDSQTARQRVLDGGARAYLRKPVSEEVLLEAIERSLGGNRSIGRSDAGSRAAPGPGGLDEETR